MEKFSFLAVLLLYSFCTCTLTQEVNDFPYDGYAPENVGEDNSLNDDGFNPDAPLDVEDNAKGDENPEIGEYQPVDDVDSGELQPSESKDDSEVSADVEGDKYPEVADNPEVSDGAEGDENPDLGGYVPVDDVDSGELQPPESTDYSEVSTDVEGDKYPEIADNPEGSVGAEGDENPDLGGYVPVDDVDSGEPSEPKDDSEVSADVEGDKYPEVADNPEVSDGAEGDENPDLGGYVPVDDVDSGELQPSESKEDSEVSADVEGDKYPEVADNSEVSVGAEGDGNPDLGGYEPVDDASENGAKEEGYEPSLTEAYPEENVDLADNSVETNASPGPVNEGDNYPESPEATGAVDANEPLEPTSYPDVITDVDEEEPYVTTVSYPEGVADVEPNEPYETTGGVGENESNEPNGMEGGTDTSGSGMETMPSEGDLPQEIPPNEGPCNYDDLNGLADRLIGDVRPMIPDIVYLPDQWHGPFMIRSFFVRGVSGFARNGQPAIACSDNFITLNIPLYWDEPLVGYFELSVARLMTEVKVALPELEAEVILDVRPTSSSTYVVYVRDVRFTRSGAPIIVTSNMGYFHRVASKLSSWMAHIFQARIRKFLSGQFQQILQEQIVKVEVGFNYRGYYRGYY